MTKLDKTLSDLNRTAKTNQFKFLVTRFNKNSPEVSDLDILVKEDGFTNVVNSLQREGYESFSHDMALGGRIPGAQINLVKEGRIKIDLHKDFTWRAKRYLDLDLVWNKTPLIDELLVFISILFEKTYIDQDDYDYIWQKKDKVFANEQFLDQAKKYGWDRTFMNFKNWQPTDTKLPLFLPFSLVHVSFLEKFHLISFMYYVFFRIRYLLTKTLPYD